MVGDHDALGPGVRGEDRVLHRLNALDDDRAVPDRAQPVHVRPVEPGVELLVHVLREPHGVDAPRPSLRVAAHRAREDDRFGGEEIPRPARLPDTVHHRVEAELRGEGEPEPDVALAPPQHRHVDREQERLVAGLRSPPDEFLDEAAVLPHVHLEPLGTRTDVRHFLDRARAEGGQAVGDPRALGRPGHGQLALGIRDAAEAGGGEDERDRLAPAEDRDARVHVRHVPQHPGPELEPVEGLAVAGLCALVLGRPVDVAEHAARHAAARECAQVVDARAAAEPPCDGVELEFSEANDRAQRLQHRAFRYAEHQRDHRTGDEPEDRQHRRPDVHERGHRKPAGQGVGEYFDHRTDECARDGPHQGHPEDPSNVSVPPHDRLQPRGDVPAVT